MTDTKIFKAKEKIFIKNIIKILNSKTCKNYKQIFQKLFILFIYLLLLKLSSQVKKNFAKE